MDIFNLEISRESMQEPMGMFGAGVGMFGAGVGVVGPGGGVQLLLPMALS